MSEKNKKMKCSNCGRKGLFYHDYDNAYWCAMCGANTNPDGTPYIAPPRQYYICPRCGKGWDYADKDQHICKNCHYEPMIKTEFSDSDYENARTSSPETFKQFKMNLREKYTVNSLQFNQKMYNELIQKEYKDYLEYEAREKEKQIERVIRTNTNNIPKCPTCGSTNIRKIPTSKKISGGLMFGLFSSNVRKTFECLNCKYKW